MTKVELTDIIANNKKLLIIKLSAEWCGPCKNLEKVLNAIKSDYVDKLEIIDIDVEKYADTANEFLPIRGLPKVVFFKNQQRLTDKEFNGVRDKIYLKKIIDSVI